MPPIRFIHAADLHLDAAFSGLSRDIPADFAERLRTATFTAFRRLLDLCERESPDFLLLAGDVYQLALRDGFRRLESLSIPVFLVHGNHDPLASRLRSVRWPGNVTVFGELPDAVPVFRKGEGTPLAIIHGASHASGRETRNLAALFRRTEACGLHVGLLHATPGDADGVARYAPFSQEDLKASGMDYWALGHIHDRREVCREPLAAYPGCTQGLHINEPGEKGCLLVTAEARPDGGYAVRTSFRPLGPAVWKTLDMDLGGAASLDELENRLRTGLDRAAAEVWSGCEMLLVRLRLQGRTELDGLLRMVDYYKSGKPAADKLKSIRFEKSRQKYKSEHDNELRTFYMAERKLKPYFKDGKLPITAWRREREQLEQEYRDIQTELSPLHADAKKLWAIHYNIYEVQHEQERQNTELRQKKQEMER